MSFDIVKGLTAVQKRAICTLLQHARLTKYLKEDGGIEYVEASGVQFREPAFIQAIQLMYQHAFIVVSEPQQSPGMRTVVYSVTNKGHEFLANSCVD